MKKKDLLSLCKKEFEPLILNTGLELYEIEYVKESVGNILRVYISKENGNVGIEDCETVSKLISDKLDELDPIEDSYFLEVSSPGIDRPFKKEKDYEKNLGETIEVKFYGSYKGKKTLTGKLLSYDENKIKVQTEREVEDLDRESISTVRLSLF